MHRSFLALALASVSLSACSTRLASEAPAPAPAPVAPAAPAAAPAPKPTIGDYGFDTAGMDKSIAPGDNFYDYANGGWAKNTPIPADKSNYGMFTVLDDLSKQRTQTILEEAKGDPNSKIGNAYASYLDQATVEARGLAPIKPWLDAIKAVKTRADYVAILAQAARNGVGRPFGGYVGQDDKAPESYIYTLTQSGLGMPDRDFYLQPGDKMEATRKAYVAHIAKMFALAGEPDGEKRAAAIMAFETAIAKVHWTRIDSRDADKTYNKMTVAQLTKLAPGFDFASLFKASGVTSDALLVNQPSAIKGEAALIAKAPLALLKDMLIIRSLDGFADYLPDAIAAENFAFYGTTLSGTPEREIRWKRAVTFVKGSLGEEVGKEYVARYFPPETKAAADQLVKNIIAAMGKRIDGLTWMSAQAKARAHQKLANFTPKIGYPDKWRDYTGYEVKRDDLFGNAIRSNQFDYAYMIGKLGQPIYRWEWQMTPMEINAYANPGMVEIVFPAAILQPPFFDPNADPAVNYGGIGAVIGHELSHHFDDQGAKYDETGKLAQWWTDQDVANFKVLTDKLVKQYDAYEPLPGEHVQGALTLGENMADLAGLTIAYDAYKAALGGKDAPVIDGTTGDQRFYLGWAQVWRRSYREANLRQRLLTDPHSPSEQRTAIVRNLDPWYDAYAIPATAKLALPSDARVRVW
ncbi:M13 family metallopeptidase [Sphingobium nicotianae]|uniref:M13 family peptidase n=1 Tax=Sphingobium nicotianae TaxID=2782607 RepID=A0A9X1ISA8_9SPHN|nr:M13-type metalloendopeptidase [Sphingobium nicotianae]MBT2188386.1 M13 family peptidase [Sphingobium nicotianae]